MSNQIETKSNKGSNPTPSKPQTGGSGIPKGDVEKGINPSPKGPKIKPPGSK